MSITPSGEGEGGVRNAPTEMYPYPHVSHTPLNPLSRGEINNF